MQWELKPLQVGACRLTHAGDFAPEIRATLEGYSVLINVRDR